ncbi:MAG: hypothetical protein IK010_06070 [Bacteroidales bacterium]|nr:hypothetical protein [Bacteroidales bacterium]
MSNRTFLHVLLVLTLVWAGLSCFAYLMMGLLMPSMQTIYEQSPSLLPEEFTVMIHRLFEIPRGYYVGAGLLYGLEVLGAAFMWRLRWMGFHCYALARLLLLLLPVLFIGKGFVGVGDIMFALLFIVVYYLLLRQLNAATDNQDKPTLPPDEDVR